MLNNPQQFSHATEKPHNPMINAGAILVCALLKTLVTPEMTLAEKFDFTMNYFKVSSLIFMYILTCLSGQGLQHSQELSRPSVRVL
jgi:hypothetical protein